MKEYISKWNFMRFLRLALGLFIFIQGIVTKDWAFITMGGLFAAMPLFNIGCASGNCTPNQKTRNRNNVDDVSFEEVK
ncbi:MAG TPA: hypothetical protein VLZ83_15605 [Edaphocola sp.]|nr:hypothetical protein [Edaphocola sp.]